MEYDEVEKLYEGLRASDVRDGLDWIGLFSKGSVSQEIGPLFEGARVAGPALTVRLTASQEQAPPLTPDEYTEWAHDYWYGSKQTSKHFRPLIRPGHVIVIEAPDLGVGQLGSNNTLLWATLGAQGVVSSGGVRDTDECCAQGIPIFNQTIGQSMTQGRIESLEHNVPVTVGGVRVEPGDLIIGDGDGVIVVPHDRIQEVAKYARQEADNDKRGRRAMYEKLGWELDETVQV